jgi:ketosteroid isomerase-like protein
MSEAELLDLLERFNRTWNDHDLDGALSLVTDDCVFDATSPAPDGERFTGKEGLRRAWGAVFGDPRSHFDTEEAFVSGDRLVQRWRYSWGDGSIRGVDVMRARDGLICEKLSYVKG